MASKNQNSNARSAEDRALDLFADLMIEKIQNIQQDWKKPWFTPQSAQLPRNLSGRQYNGFNSIVLMMMQEKHGWQTDRGSRFRNGVSGGGSGGGADVYLPLFAYGV